MTKISKISAGIERQWHTSERIASLPKTISSSSLIAVVLSDCLLIAVVLSDGSLEFAHASQASGPSVWAKINDLLEPNQRSWEFQAEEKAGKKPPRRSARAPVAPRPDDDSSDPARLLGKSAQDPEVKAFIAKNAATDRLRKASGVEVKIDGDGRLATIWLTAGKTASSVVTRGVRLGMSQPEMTAVLGRPTRRGASWERFDDQTVALHLELKEGEVVRLTLMWRASMPPSLR